ncbi:hypothetical protein EJ02DRAFT_454703 [Clathrospora elynae]|uniref:Uncharacterized protein n=1 Tax=Clathrospora elynae TaxID=706981 RepID=A0A6A5STF9_9PLEO|nr:hypothetical protein EJ02DRAFT_454703 [Clathrospora elynae]
MYFAATTLTTALLTALTAAAPSTLNTRQSGGDYVSVGNKYSGGGCTPSSLIFADPIFGNGNACQALDRIGGGAPIVSYSTLSVNAGCSVTLYTAPNCGGTAFSAPVGQCVQGSSPFVSTFVKCT